jgi:hypothetical protein
MTTLSEEFHAFLSGPICRTSDLPRNKQSEGDSLCHPIFPWECCETFVKVRNQKWQEGNSPIFPWECCETSVKVAQSTGTDFGMNPGMSGVVLETRVCLLVHFLHSNTSNKPASRVSSRHWVDDKDRRRFSRKQCNIVRRSYIVQVKSWQV